MTAHLDSAGKWIRSYIGKRTLLQKLQYERYNLALRRDALARLDPLSKKLKTPANHGRLVLALVEQEYDAVTLRLAELETEIRAFGAKPRMPVLLSLGLQRSKYPPVPANGWSVL